MLLPSGFAASVVDIADEFAVNTITHSVITVLRNPEPRPGCSDRPELIPGAIEEVQRMRSSVQFFRSRSATTDIEIGGTVIPKGSAVHHVWRRQPRRNRPCRVRRRPGT